MAITKGDLDSMLGRVRAAAERLGHVREGWRWSLTNNGRCLDTGRVIFDEIYLGRTKSEAWSALHGMALAFEMTLANKP